MADPRTLVRLLDELIWTLRREGFDLSTAQALDIARAVHAVGFADRNAMREAIACVAVSRAADRVRFDAVFGAFFASAATGERTTVRQRLGARGFDSGEQLELERALGALPDGDALINLLERGAELDRAIVDSGVRRALDEQGASQLGYQTHRLLRIAGLDRARHTIHALRGLLRGALGPRGAALADAIAEELTLADEHLRAYARRVHAEGAAGRQAAGRDARIDSRPYSSGRREGELEPLRRALRVLAERLRGAARVRVRRATRGAIDGRRTLRESMRTACVPFALKRRARRRHLPKVVILCDVSDSVRFAARLLLEFTYAVQELFDRARTFVFISELGETTGLFERQNAAVAVEAAWQGAGVVPAHDNSNYGRVLRAFDRRHTREIDKRTTVVILGDGRTNYLDAGAKVLDRIRGRARALYWLCPERRAMWSHGDSAMSLYAPKCTAVFDASALGDLERAARAIAKRS